MTETTDTGALTAPLKRKLTGPYAAGFSPRRRGGRQVGSPNKRTRQALEICEQLDFHPAAFLTVIAMTGLMPNADGTSTPVSPDERLKAAVALCPFVMPRLQATQTQITGKDEGPVQVLDLSKILADPELCRQAQSLALAMCEVGEAPKLPAPIYSGLRDQGQE